MRGSTRSVIRGFRNEPATRRSRWDERYFPVSAAQVHVPATSAHGHTRSELHAEAKLIASTPLVVSIIRRLRAEARIAGGRDDRRVFVERILHVERETPR